MQYCTIFTIFLQYFFKKIFAFFNNLEIFLVECEYFEKNSVFLRDIHMILFFHLAFAFILRSSEDFLRFSFIFYIIYELIIFSKNT